MNSSPRRARCSSDGNILRQILVAAAIAGKSRAVLALGKAAFYRQIEQGFDAAYEATGSTMAPSVRAWYLRSTTA